ncbi:BRO-N domain-containing protein [Desulfovibrio aminophilus]|uniref:BRO-N domain-containing protein n=1 Tax=Desulfovibrio aminophilus TaxID=81425 RepID=UPI0004078D91|nr:BRO family protein [Desulfovibrio aminophilus]
MPRRRLWVCLPPIPSNPGSNPMFKFEGKDFRAVIINNAPWFAAVDLASALGKKRDSYNMVDALKPDEWMILHKNKAEVSSLVLFNGNAARLTLVSESGLYKLIMRAHPNVNPVVKRFQDWVTRDVLPALRKDESPKAVPVPAVKFQEGVQGFHFFNPGDGHFEVRVMMDEQGNPWFVAKDVDQALGYVNPRKAVGDHCKKTSAVTIRDTSSNDVEQGRSVTLIPEADVYRLIMRSKLPSAQKFEEWVVGTVLPALRKDGMYVMGEEKVKSGEMSHHLPRKPAGYEVIFTRQWER